ncbi:uncharacterized protein LOC131079523 isoform X2 [Cryptomeria japonica]|uniref:uncharacterized protein LOC131079523 isoform X2 n=1 Tax=Cryptomeria japonica TaxID=3369 RepID=UPI0025ABCE45|nr:uncharacterized protein LOC131079523 isoform X2 [Cryptomeria japonica]
MEDPIKKSSSSRTLELSNMKGKKGAPHRSSFIASVPKALLQNTIAPIVKLKEVKITRESSSHLLFFLLKTVALEVVRRVSKRRFPLLWNSIQGICLLNYPPFSWLQKWMPFRHLGKGAQEFTGPLLCLSIATAFVGSPEELEHSTETQADNSTASDSVCTEQIDVGERIKDDELERFYIAAGGDFSMLLSSVKKTIRWRETYYILTPQELDGWSDLVFWHGYDIQFRPCLLIRLGLACSCLQPDARARFSQAVVSQVEYGILNLLNLEDPRITVLMDCEGISTLRFPMHMVKSCSNLLQNHYPSRLAALYVTNLSPIVRVIAQTLIQVLKPVTREKLHILGDNYPRILSEYLELVPSFLGGDCKCTSCTRVRFNDDMDIVMNSKSSLHGNDEMDIEGTSYDNETSQDVGSHVLRAIIVALLMFWVLVATLAGFYESDQQNPST